MSRRARFAVSAFLAIVFAAPSVRAQPPSAIPPNPQSPSINLPQPSGAQPGTSTELTLSGSNLTDPTALIIGFPGKVSFPTDANNGKDASKLRVKIEIDSSAKVGMYSIRLVTRQGVSNPRAFCIDDLPIGPTANGNRSVSTAMSLPVPSVASGRVDGETSEYFRMHVSAGQRVSMEVLARRLGSALDPIILIHDGKTGQEVPGLYSDDSPGCQTDCRLIHTFKQAGDYIIEVRDSTHRGGGEFWYRLRVGDFPCAITPMPLAAKRGSTAVVGFAGQDVDGVVPMNVDVPADPGLAAIPLVPKGSRPHSGWPVSLLLSDSPELLEQEPNNDPAHANRLPVPCGISGRFQEKSDRDCFAFTAKKGQRLLINAQTYELLSPADVSMTLKNAQGSDVAANNPQNGAGIDYTAQADGDLTLVVEHLNYLFGPNEVYHLTIAHPEPGIEFTLAATKIEIPAGGATVIPIQSLIRRDFAGPVEVGIVGESGLSGSTVITAAGPLAPNLPIGLLTITHSGGPLTGRARVRAKATVNGKQLISFADLSAAVRNDMAGIPFPPREFSRDLAVGTTEPMFKLTAKYAFAECLRGTPLNLIITATRSAGFTDDIALSVVDLPPNVTAAPKPVAKGSNDATFPISAAGNAPLGLINPVVIGRGKYQNRDFVAAIAAPIELVANPVELAAAPVAPLKSGDKARFKVTAKRKGGYAGSIDLDVKNLPAGVTAPKTTIPAGMNETEIELTATANAAPAEKGDVIVSGNAAGQIVNTGAFKVAVTK